MRCGTSEKAKSFASIMVTCEPPVTSAGLPCAVFVSECMCDVCTLYGETLAESDRRRTAIRRLFDEFGNCAKEPTLGMRKLNLSVLVSNSVVALG
ncbi:hypothetical protein BKA93DRAFT_791621 [Sparassis latifolia]